MTKFLNDFFNYLKSLKQHLNENEIQNQSFLNLTNVDDEGKFCFTKDTVIPQQRKFKKN